MKQIESFIATNAQLLNRIGRILLICSFIEDTVRMILDWRQQLTFFLLHKQYYSLPTKLFLLFSICALPILSTLLVNRKNVVAAAITLACLVVTQIVVYNIYLNTSLLLRNISIIGGLATLLGHELQAKKEQEKAKIGAANLPQNEALTASMATVPGFLCLLGRALLIVFFVAQILGETFKFLRYFTCILASVFILLGYRAQLATIALAGLLLVCNLAQTHWLCWWAANNFDYFLFDFFQLTSILGGLLLLVSSGAGALSVDALQKKHD